MTVHIEELPGSRALRIAVHDDGGLALASPHASTGLPGAAECGYGLGIVAAVAAHWGSSQHTDGHRVTWSVIASAGDLT